MGMPTRNGMVTVGNNKFMHLWPDSLLGEFTKASESLISETSITSKSPSAFLLIITKVEVSLCPFSPDFIIVIGNKIHDILTYS